MAETPSPDQPAGPAPDRGGHPPAGMTGELARLERQIAALAAANVKLDHDREDLAHQIEVVRHRRDVLAHTIAQRQQASSAARTLAERQIAERQRTAAARAAAQRRTPRQAEAVAPPTRPDQTPPSRAVPRVAPPPPEPRVQVAPLPEASSRSVQTIMLGLGGLLIGIASVVFVGVAITTLEPGSQLVIMLAVALLFLAVGPPVAGRGLSATAETLSVVGLVVFAVAGYPLWMTGAVDGIPQSVYIGLLAAATAIVGYGYHLLTRLTAPAWVAILTLQPVLPLLAEPLVTGPAGWALVFTLVAGHNAALAATVRSRLLGYLGWALHGLAVVIALGFALAGLFLAGTVAAATPSALLLVLTATLGVVGAAGYGRQPLPDVAAGITTLAVIVAASRLAALALGGRALLPIAAIMTATALAVLLLPREWRRGPQRASAWAIAAFGVVLAALAVRAGVAAVVWPPWPDDLTGYRSELVAAAGPATWQLAVTAVAATIGAGFALPPAFRREVTVAGAGLAAMSTPASLGLAPATGAWVLALTAAGLALTGLTSTTVRGAVTHVLAAGVVAAAAIGASLAGPELTAAILAALALAGVATAAVPRGIIGLARRGLDAEDDTGAADARQARAGAAPDRPASLVAGWSAAAAAVTLPAAAATGAYAAGYDPPEVLAAAFAAVCGTLGYAALLQLRRSREPAAEPFTLPVRAGAGLGAFGVAFGAFTAQAESVDLGIAVLLAISAVAVLLSPRVDAIRRPGRWYDGAEVAAAAVTAAVVATLARIAALTLPINDGDGGIATASAIVLLVALGVRMLPQDMWRGPVLGVGLVGGLVAAIAAAAAVASAAAAPVALGPVWNADLTRWPPSSTVAELSWGAPAALVMLAVAAAAVLPRPGNHFVGAALAGLATVGASVPLGLPWWAPAALSVAVASGYALSAALRRQAATSHGVVAAALAVYAAVASTARPGTTAAVLAVVVLVGAVVAALALLRADAGAQDEPAPPDPRLRVGGVGVTAALLGLSGMLAALAAGAGQGVALLAALGGATGGLALVAALREPIEPYLPYATIGITGAATGTALATLPGDTYPTSVYAAAAVLLAVLAELIRGEQRRSRHVRYQAAAHSGTDPRTAGPGPGGRYATGQPPPRTLVTPQLGALLAALPPAALALIGIAPALFSALVDPYRTLNAIWEGPPSALTDVDTVPAASVLAALLLTLAAAIAAIGFGGAVTRQAVVLVAPGLAVTVLIAPAALDAPWPTGTVAALVVFTISMLGVALTPPPPPQREARPLRAARLFVLAIGLAAGGAGLAGSLAEPNLTWATFGGAIGVGVAAGVAGQTPRARLLGWLGASVAAQAFALTTTYLLGASWPRAGFALLVVAAVALLAATRLARLRDPSARAELAAVEWLGGYLSLAFAVTFGIGSWPDLAAILIGAGAIVGLAALRPGRFPLERRILWWLAAAAEVLAAWILLAQFSVGLLEAYTLPFALFALAVGALELRYRPELSSWVTFAPGLVAALGPSLLLVITTTDPSPVRQIWVILGGVAVLLLGARFRQHGAAPLIIGSVVTTLAALHLLSLAGPWLILIPLGLLLLLLGANREKQQRALDRLRDAYSRRR